MASLIEQFNDSVANYEAQTDRDWQSKAANSLARKFRMLAKGIETEDERKELIDGMVEFMADYIGANYDDDDLEWDVVDRDTKSIGAMGDALVSAAVLGSVPAGTAKRFNLLAAKVVGFGESANDGDTDQAYQEQAEKVSEIADALQRFEAAPAPKPQPASFEAPASDTGAASKPLKLKL